MALAIPIIVAVASIAGTAYSSYSSSEGASKAKKEAKEAAAISKIKASELAKNTAANEAAMAESKRIKARRAMAGTIKTSPEGLTEAPTVMKQTLGD